MPHPIFFAFRTRAARVRLDGRWQPLVLRADRARMRGRFRGAPRLGLEHGSGRFTTALSNWRQQGLERGRGRFRIGRRQPCGIAGHHGTALAPKFGRRPASVSHTRGASGTAAQDGLPWARPWRFGTPIPCLTLTAFITRKAHALKTPCRTPIGSDLEAVRGGCVPEAPHRRPFCESITPGCNSDFGVRSA